MKTCSKCQESKPLTEFTWRKDVRYSKGGYYASRCKICICANTKVWTQANKEHAYAKQAEWRDANRGQWNSRMAVATKRRQAAQLQRVPPWYDQAKTQEIYDLAAEFREAGFEVDVDHIEPLQGETVSGLHWHGNLRVCLAGVNRSKGNKQSQLHN